MPVAVASPSALSHCAGEELRELRQVQESTLPFSFPACWMFHPWPGSRSGQCCTSLHLPAGSPAQTSQQSCALTGTSGKSKPLSPQKSFFLSSSFLILCSTAPGKARGAAQPLWLYLLPGWRSPAQQHQEIQNGSCLPWRRSPKIQHKGRFQALAPIPLIYYYNQFSSLNKCTAEKFSRWDGVAVTRETRFQKALTMLLRKKFHSLGWAEAFLLS